MAPRRSKATNATCPSTTFGRSRMTMSPRPTPPSISFSARRPDSRHKLPWLSSPTGLHRRRRGGFRSAGRGRRSGRTGARPATSPLRGTGVHVRSGSPRRYPETPFAWIATASGSPRRTSLIYRSCRRPGFTGSPRALPLVPSVDALQAEVQYSDIGFFICRLFFSCYHPGMAGNAGFHGAVRQQPRQDPGDAG